MNDLLQILIATTLIIYIAGILTGLAISWAIDKWIRKEQR